MGAFSMLMSSKPPSKLIVFQLAVRTFSDLYRMSENHVAISIGIEGVACQYLNAHVHQIINFTIVVNKKRRKGHHYFAKLKSMLGRLKHLQ